MKGDFSRSTYQKEKHYRSVRMQQGRVQVDADWNEQLDLAEYRVETGTLDLIGPAGTPRANPGFALVANETDLPPEWQDAAQPFLPLPPGDFFIGPGRYYVDGILCENETLIPFSQQIHLPDADRLPGKGTYLVYLDVWVRHLTALEDPFIKESALGGPDTATRTQTIWQVKWENLGSSTLGCQAPIPKQVSTGALSIRVQPKTDSSDPCLIAPDAGFQGLENRLYRVEVHEGGELGKATFKWSRDNGSVVTEWVLQEGETKLIVAHAGRDTDLGFRAGDWVELTDDTREFQGIPGVMVRIQEITEQAFIIEALSTPVDIVQFPRNPKIRKWDTATGTMGITLPGSNEGFLEVEAGIEVKFEPGTYHTGDYWLIPARTMTGDVIWPHTEPQGPLGIHHHYSPLGVLTHDGNVLSFAQDCRTLFPSVTELTSLFYVGGDGQEAAPGFPLLQPLQVGVANGKWPVPGATVQFRMTIGAGEIQGQKEPVTVLTDRAGIAECTWRLDTATPSQQVEATLLSASGLPLHLPIRFNASLGEQTFDEGIHVTGLTLAQGDPLDNDAEIPINKFAEGITIACDREIDPNTLGERPVCLVTLDLPWPFTEDEKQFWGKAVLGFRPIRLAAATGVKGPAISWVPLPETKTWLQKQLLSLMTKMERGSRILARLTVKGNFVWQQDKPEVWLDGDVFGIPAKAQGSTSTAIKLPSGNGRRGGDLEMWFWLIEEVVQPKIEVKIVPDRFTVLLNETVEFLVTVQGTGNQNVTFTVNKAGTVKKNLKKPGWWIYNAPPEIPKINPVTVTFISEVGKAEQTATFEIIRK